ncbi:MAG TPA: LysR substrate-binding domain-containing protein [Gammaproteobacteria bacterium]
MTPISDIAVFVRVVEQGSFTAAAASLGSSKAAISKYVGRLEKRLGARLLNRTTRRLTLTEAGESLYARAGAAIADLATAEAEILELASTPRGRLRVSAPSHFGEVFLAPLVADFRNRYPDVTLDLDLDNRIVDLVEEGFDAGIRITTLANSSLVARKLADIRMVTIASPAYLAKHGKPETPPDLRDHECLAYSLDRAPGEWRYRSGLHRLVSVRVQGSFRCNNDGALKRAALDGLGILRFPELFVEQELREGKLVAVLQEFEMQKVTLSAVFPTRAHLAPKVRVFVDFLAARFDHAKEKPEERSV